MTQEFKATMDTNTKTLTWIVSFIVVATIVVLLIPFANSDPWVWLFAAPIVLIMFIAYLLRPVKYILDEQNLIVQKGMGSKMILLNDIFEVRALNQKDLGFGIRAFGVGGFFGYYGKFYYNKIGSVTAYVTNVEKMIFIKTKSGKKYLISPDDTLEFMNSINQKIPNNKYQNPNNE